MAGMPSGVAGIFTNTLGRSMRVWRSLAALMVPAVSRANSGATSIDTNPSRPPLASNTGRSNARALRKSSMTRSQYASTSDLPLAVNAANWSS